MKKDMKTRLILVAAVVAVLAGATLLKQASADRPKRGSEAVRTARRAKPHAASPAADNGVKITETKIDPESANPRGLAEVGSELDGEKALTEEFRSLLEELRAAFDASDRTKVIDIVKRLQSREGWPDDVPQSVKSEALEALAWFGPSCLPEAVGFISDTDADVSEDVVDAFDDMLMDFEGGDRALADIVKTVTRSVHNRDVLETFVSELGNMRNSVKVDTALAIMDSGNADAIAVLKENADSIFDECEEGHEVETREDIVKYGEDNPDDEDDEDTYGPEDDDDSDDDSDDDDDD